MSSCNAGLQACRRGSMKAIRVHECGGPAVMKLEEVPDPAAGPGRGRRARARGRRESGRRLHRTPARTRASRALPLRRDRMARAKSQSVGADVKEFAAGDRVYICRRRQHGRRRRHLRASSRSAPVAAASAARARLVRPGRGARRAVRTAYRALVPARARAARRDRARSTAPPAASGSRAWSWRMRAG